MVERIEAGRKINCANAKPLIPYKPVRLMTKPAGAAAAVQSDVEAALGPAGEVGGMVPSDMARLMLIPAGVAAPVAGGCTLGEASLASLRHHDPQCCSCSESDNDDELAVPMSAVVPLTAAAIAQLARDDPQCAGSDGSSDGQMPGLVYSSSSDAEEETPGDDTAPPAMPHGMYPAVPPASPSVPIGSPVVMTPVQKRESIGALSPAHKVSEIAACIAAAGLPVSPAVGGSLPGSGPKGGRTKGDIINDALMLVQLPLLRAQW